MFINSTGNVGIGTTSPGAKFEVYTGAGRYAQINSIGGALLKTNDNSTQGLTLENTYTGQNYGTTVLFNLGYDGLSTAPGTTVAGGKIIVAQEQSWSSTASTQDSYMTFQTTLDGAMAEKMRITSGGNVGIGTTAPDQALDIIGRIQMSTWTADGDTAVYRDDGTGNLGLVTSDRRLKKNIEPVTGSLDIVNRLNAYKYNELDETDGTKKRLGVMAQEILPYMPELTYSFTREGSSKTYYGVHYDKLPVLLLGAMKEQQGMIIEQRTVNNEQQAQISDMNLKTSQNVETVAGLQKSVDENLAVISGNFSAVEAKLALHDTAINGQGTTINEQQNEVSSFKFQVSNEIQNLNDQIANANTQYSILNTQYTLSESDLADLESRLALAEGKLKTAELNLADFEVSASDTLSAMLETENMLTEKLLSHEDRIAALEAKILALSISGGGVGQISDNVLVKDQNGGLKLEGVFEAKEVVAGAFAVKNESQGEKTMGEETILAGESEKFISARAVSENTRIFVTFESDSGGRFWTEKKADSVTGEYTGFVLKLSEPARADARFSWWIVESR
jgi:hypothetical protein